MQIQDQIQAIIDKRHEKLPVIDQKLKALDAIQSAADRAETMRGEMIDAQGNVLPDSRFAALLYKHPGIAWEIQKLNFEAVRDAVSHAREALEEYRKRCARDAVYIAVVGKARMGKSELLKSISGLSDKVIPAFNGFDCTGTPSVIHNEPDSGFRAEVAFKSKEEMRQIAQDYLDVMIEDLSKRPILRSMEAIRSLNIEEVEGAMPAFSPEKRKLSYLKKIKEHYDGTDGWAQCAGKTTTILDNEDEVMPLVAQNNGKEGDEKENYYKYLAVKSCNVYCSFPRKDVGKICLVDTVGIGDRAIGIEDSMLRTIKDSSDAVIIVYLPKDATGRGLDDSFSKGIYEPIMNAFAGKQLNNWLFWLINEVRVSKPPIYENVELCKTVVEELKTMHWAGTDTAKAVSVVDAEEVDREFLLPMLHTIANNLDSIDQTYCDSAAEALKKVQYAYGALCAGAKKALHSDLSSNIKLIPVISELVDQEIDVTLRSNLFKTAEEWREKRGQPCVVINDTADSIIRKMRALNGETYLPPQDEILRSLKTGKVSNLVYTACTDKIRNEISRDFLNVDIDLHRVIVDMKNELARVMFEGCGLSRLCPPPEDPEMAYRWFNDFCESVLGDGYPKIRLAMETISEFEFSVKGFLTYEVRNCLDILDMHYHQVPSVFTDSISMTAQNIYFDLHRQLGSIAGNLKTVLKELCIKPNRAMFAEVADFCDRIYYTEGVEREWRNLLMDQAPVLWAEEIRQHQKQGVLFQEWLDMIEELQAQNSVAVFRI